VPVCPLGNTPAVSITQEFPSRVHRPSPYPPRESNVHDLICPVSGSKPTSCWTSTSPSAAFISYSCRRKARFKAERTETLIPSFSPTQSPPIHFKSLRAPPAPVVSSVSYGRSRTLRSSHLPSFLNQTAVKRPSSVEPSALVSWDTPSCMTTSGVSDRILVTLNA